MLAAPPLRLDALVLESVYPDINAALTNRLRASLGPVLGTAFIPVLTPMFETLLPPLLGLRVDDLRPIDVIGNVTAPVLVASGTADNRTPLSEVRDLFDRVPQEIEHRRRIHRLKMAEGNASAGALAMGLEIEQQHCKSVRVEQFRAVDHALSIGSHSVHEQNGTAARPARHQPSMQH